MEWAPLGEAWIVRGLAPGAAAALARRPPPGVIEAWASGDAAGVLLAPGVSPAAVVWPEPDLDPPRLHEIAVRYDGEDLPSVAEELGMSAEEVIARHSAREYVCAMVGFCPGFGYLDGLDPALELPRLASPRPRVPAGAVAIAGTRTAIYPLERPGGWRLIATTEEAMVHVGEGFCRLAAGDRVRFKRAD